MQTLLEGSAGHDRPLATHRAKDRLLSVSWAWYVDEWLAKL
jgi:hypothetical protein